MCIESCDAISVVVLCVQWCCHHVHLLLSYHQQLTGRAQETDSVVSELRQQVSTLSDQLSKKATALNDELARAEQQVHTTLIDGVQ